jgi:hypothetical protein
MMEPVIMALKNLYAGDVEFIIADFDNPDPETYALMEIEEFKVAYIPMFFFINGQGEIVSAEAGVFSLEQMVERIGLILGEAVE